MDQRRPTGPIEVRLALLQELAQSLSCAQLAIVRSDFGEIKTQTARQLDLCLRLRAHGVPPPDLLNTQKSRRETETRDRPGECSDALAKQLGEMEIRVARLNRSYAALLRRARRTVDIFCRVLTDSAATYAPPLPTLQAGAVLRSE